MSSIFGRLFQKDHGTSNTPKPAFGLGDVVNQRYRLEAEIGRGGMGIIYRAYDLAKNRKVAFKVIHPETANALSLGQFAREAEILSRLYHPHIVSLFETGFVNDDLSLPFLVMEFLQGLALSEAGTLTYPRIVSVAKQVCEALEYIHRQGYVYRDLKPNNILLEKRGFQVMNANNNLMLGGDINRVVALFAVPGKSAVSVNLGTVVADEDRAAADRLCEQFFNGIQKLLSD